MDLYLKGKTALVTGGSQGLGRAIAKALAIEGVKVLVTARNEDLLKSLREEVVAADGIEPVTFVQDFLAPDSPQNIRAAALSSLGWVDLLINNTGRSRAMGVVGPEEEWDAAMMMDFDRHRQLTQQLLPHLIERRQGAILNVTSTYELRSINGSAVAKAAIAVWSKQLAGQLGPFGIRVNCLQPGLIDTENIRRLFPGDERRKFADQEIPLGDFGEPQDVANMAAFLLSPRARYITGTVAVVDGGLRRYPF
jgi:3-oxoacyl-[acyl-carrier protein] reductase